MDSQNNGDPPFEMEELGDMADLFGETQSMVTSPVSALSPSLVRRIDELGLSGCCQKIAWSKSSSIARITAEGDGVEVYGFMYDEEKKDYTLSDPSTLELPNGHHLPIVHVSWGKPTITPDLVVVDTLGGVSIFTPLFSINLLRLAKFFPADPSHGGTRIVGMEWLWSHLGSRATGYYHTAQNQQGSWTYSEATYKPGGPLHPLSGKSSFVVITQKGKLRLFFPSSNGRWSDDEMDLAHFSTQQNMLTHASLAPFEDESFLITTYSMSASLNILQATIKWNTSHPNTGPKPPSDYEFSPKMTSTCFMSVPHLSIEPQNQEFQCSTQLSSLHVLPPATEPHTEKFLPPTIVASVITIENHPDIPVTQRSLSSRLVYWTMNTSRHQGLHPSFSRMASKTGKKLEDVTQHSYHLTRNPDIDLSGVPVQMHLLRANTNIILALSDGSIGIWDRLNMQRSSINLNWDKISTWTQAGFEFPTDSPCIHVDLSPNACIAVAEGTDRSLFLKKLEVQIPGPDAFNSQLQSAALVGQCLVFATSCLQPFNSEDIVALMRHTLPIFGHEKLLRGMYDSCDLAVDFTADNKSDASSSVRLLSNMPLVRCLSVQQTFEDENGTRTIPAKAGCIMLELRSICISVYTAMNTIEEIPEGSYIDFPWSLRGLMKWFIDIMGYLIGGLLYLQREVKGRENDQARIQEKVQTSRAECVVALATVMGSVPRNLLRLCCRFFRTLFDRKFRVPLVGNMHGSLAYLIRMVETNPIDIRRFEHLLEEVQHYVREAYDQAGLADAERSSAERDILVTSQIPKVLLGVVQRLLTTTLEKLIMEGDEVKVEPFRVMYNTELRLLRLTEDQKTVNWAKAHVVDAIRKRPIPEENMAKAKIRKCMRCSAYMENLMLNREVNQWIKQIGKTCVCGSMWVLVWAPKLTVTDGESMMTIV